MNDIETMFYDAWIERGEKGKKQGLHPTQIRPQVSCGGYIIDFVVDYYFQINAMKIAIEIDGHESHKTKAQRLNDYARERFLMAKNMLVIRFTASEVFVDARSCVDEVWRIIYAFDYAFFECSGELIDGGVRLGEALATGLIKPPPCELTQPV